MIRKMRIILLGVTPIKYPNLLLAFVCSDYVNLNVGQAGYVGQYGYSWSRTSKSSIRSYDLLLGPTNVNPSDNSNRFYGFPPSAASTQVVPNGGKGR